MRDVLCTMVVSLDGYVTDPDGAIDWAAPDPELFAFVTERTRALSAYVMGRRLYETMLFWARVDLATLDDAGRAWAAVWNPLEKVVFSRTLSSVEGDATRLATGGLAEELDALRGAPGEGDIAIGGPTLAHAAAALGQIDVYEPRVAPVLTGGGTPFYPQDGRLQRLELVASQTFPSQAVWSRYRVQR